MFRGIISQFALVDLLEISGSVDHYPEWLGSSGVKLFKCRAHFSMHRLISVLNATSLPMIPCMMTLIAKVRAYFGNQREMRGTSLTATQIKYLAATHRRRKKKQQIIALKLLGLVLIISYLAVVPFFFCWIDSSNACLANVKGCNCMHLVC